MYKRQYGIWLTAENSNIRQKTYETTSTGTSTITTSNQITNNQWHHITITATKGGTTKIYINGKLDIEGTNDGDDTTTNGWCIGDLRPNRDLPFDGTLDEIRISFINRSDAWINATYTSMTDQLITYGEEERNIVETCNATFVVSASEEAGGNTWQIRCAATSSSAPISYSKDVNLTINDHPTASWSYPANGTWLHGTEVLNASASFDSDGNITLYTFELDNNTNFDHPAILCSSAYENCTFDTTTQNQCKEEDMECYLKLGVKDDKGLNNYSIISVGIDNTGPTSHITKPTNGTNITARLYNLNATITDLGSGVDTTVFLYRRNSTDNWSLACADRDGTAPYNCTWNITGLVDGNYYQILVYANDSEGNTGNNDTAYNITLDRNPPTINLKTPYNNSWSLSSVVFLYNVTDATSNIENCSLVIDNKINKTNNSITEGADQYFEVYNLPEGSHSWNINCSDNLGNENNSEIRVIKIDVTGPTVIIDIPTNFTNISSASYILNASAVDDGVGVNTTVFNYRENNTAAWKTICEDTTLPYKCVWNTSILEEGTGYQIMVYANDSLGTFGNNDTRYGITIDRTPPRIYLEGPENMTQDVDGIVVFSYNVSDELVDVANCSIIINGTINSTNTSITENVTQEFSINLANGTYSWYINCTDSASNTNSSIEYMINISPDVVEPKIMLVAPEDNSTDSDGNIIFQYNVTDDLSAILNCSLIINGTINQTAYNPQQAQTNSFYVNGMRNGFYVWSVNCTDNASLPNTGNSSTYSLTVSKSSAMFVNVTTDKAEYEEGEVAYITTNTTDIFGNPLNTSVITHVIPNGTWLDPMYRYRIEINITEQSNKNLTEYQINVSIDTATLISQGKMKRNCYDVRFSDKSLNLIPYYIENTSRLKCNTHNTLIWVQVPKINANTVTTIYMYYGNPQETESLSNKFEVFNYSTPTPTQFVVSETMAIHDSFDLVSFTDNNQIKVGSVTTILNTSDTREFTGIYNYTNVSATQPFFASGDEQSANSGGEDALAPISYASKEFIYLNRIGSYKDRFYIYSPFGNATVELYEGNDGTLPLTRIGVINVTAGTVGVIVSGVYSSGESSYINATLPVIVAHDINGSLAYDAYVLHPPETDWWGVPSRYLTIAALEDNTQVQILISNGTNRTISLDAYEDYNIYDGASSQGGGQAFHIVSNKPVGVAQYADGDGGEETTFLPDYELDTEYVIPHGYDYIAIATTQAKTNCSRYDSSGNYIDSQISSSSGTYPFPGKILFGARATSSGDRIVCNSTAYMYYEYTGAGDEHNLWSVKANRQYHYPEPYVSIGGETEPDIKNQSETGFDGIWTWPWSTLDKQIGNYTAVSRATNPEYDDGVGLTTFSIVEDSTAPTVSLVTPSNYSINPGSITFSYIPSDNSHEFSNCSIILDNRINATDFSIADAEINNFTISGINEGKHNWSINCTDRNGNSNNSEMWVFRVDLTVPAITLLLPINGYNSSSDILNFNFTVSDNMHNTLLCNITVDDGIINEQPLSAQNGSYTNFTSDGFSDGIHKWNVTCWDNATNKNTSLTKNFTIDTIQPRVGLIYPHNNGWYNKSQIQMNYTPYDINLLLCELWGNFSGIWKKNQTDNSPTNNATNNFSMIYLKDGTYHWNINCSDYAGNSAFNNTNYTFSVDTNSPMIDYVYPTPQNNTNFSTTVITINVTHTENNPNTIVLYWNGTPYARNYSGNYTNFTLSGLTDGTYSFYVALNDSASNNNQTTTRTIRIDLTPPSIEIITPTNNSWRNNATSTVIFSYNTEDKLSVTNCSLIINNKVNLTNTTIKESILQNFTQTLDTGYFNWSINCSDTVGNENKSEVRVVKVDLSFPSISKENVNVTSVDVTRYICINATVYDNMSGVDSVYAIILDPEDMQQIVYLYDNETTSCDNQNNNNVYSAEWQVMKQGQHNLTTIVANDTAGNINKSYPGLNFSATSVASLQVNMSAPDALKINESGMNNDFTMNCSVTCQSGSVNCTFVTMYAVYSKNGGTDITTETIDLINDINGKYCGNLAPNQSCNYTFHITAGDHSGNNRWQVWCRGESSNAGSYRSDNEINLTVNDAPTANLSYPTNGTWLHGIEVLNASASFDSDGNITLYLFEIDNNSNFTTPTTICSTTDDNCTFNTTAQTTCAEESLNCFLRLNLTDNNDLQNSTYIVIGIDNTGPTVTLNKPQNYSNITTHYYELSASVTDNGIGVNTTVFLYRENPSASWNLACADTDGTAPYNCTWNITSLSDGNYYQILVYANDSLGNIGNNDTSYNVTLDRAPPNIILGDPQHDTWSLGDVNFYYTPNDTTSGIANCSLVLNGHINSTNTSITEGVTHHFELRNMSDGSYLWNITCYDALGNKGTSTTRNINIDNTGPQVRLDIPKNMTNISQESYIINASVQDNSGVGVESAVFYYRNTTSNEWHIICIDRVYPYSCNWNTENLSEGYNYKVMVWANDSLGNSGNNDTHYNITIDKTAPAVNSITPDNNTQDVDGQVVFYYNVSDFMLGITNCSLIINNSIYATNFTIEEEATQLFEQSINNGSYVWKIECFDSAGNSNSSEARVLVVGQDIEAPQVSLISPANGSTYSRRDVVFRYTVTDTVSEIRNCSLILNGKLNTTNQSAISEEEINSFIVYDVPDGNYSWSVNCTDTAENPNTGSSPTWNFTLIESAYIVMNLSLDKVSYERGEIALITTNTTDRFGNPLDTNVTTVIVLKEKTWHDKWVFRQQINITEQSGKNLTDYQVNITINTETLIAQHKMNSDCSDMRFIDNESKNVSYWIESGCNTTLTRVWLKINLSAYSTKSIYVYYGNFNTSNTSNFDKVFTKEYDETNLEAEWHMDAGSGITVYDNTSNNIDGTFYGSPTWNSYDGGGWDGKDSVSFSTGSSIQLDHDGDWIHFGDVLNNVFGTSNSYVTITGWIKPYYDYSSAADESNHQVSNCFLAKASDYHNDNIEIGFEYGAIELYLDMGSDACDPTAVKFGSGITLNNWHFIAVRYDNGNTDVWIDGNKYSSSQWSGCGNFDSAVGSDFALGRTNHSEASNFEGELDEFRIYSRALSDEEIKSIYERRKYISQKPTVSYGKEERAVANYTNATGTDGLWTWHWSTFNQSYANYTVRSVAVNPSYYPSIKYSSFEIVPDSTVPSIVLNAPGNNSWKGTSSVTLIYIPIDNSHHFSNCSLMFNGKFNQTNSSAIRDSQKNNFTINGLTEGLYNWSVNCTDYVGLQNSSAVWTFYVDLTRPSVDLIAPVEGYNSSSDVIGFNFTVIDNMDTNLTCNITIDSNTNKTLYAVNGSVTNTTIVGLSSGNHFWNITCWDNANNTNTSVTRRFYIDVGAPKVSLNYPQDGSWDNDGYVQMSYTPEDDNLLMCELWGNFSGAWEKNQTDKDPTNGVINTFSQIRLADGTYSWNVNCSDYGGNYAFNDTNYTVNIDTVTPAIEFGTGTEQNDTYWVRSWVYINVTAYDENEANITFSIYNTTSAVNITTLGKGNRSINFTHLKMNARYYYNVTITDKAGNKNSTATRTIVLDDVAPVVVFTDNTDYNNSYRSRNWVYLEVNVTESFEANITFYIYNLTGSLVNVTNYSTSIRSINFTNLNSNMEYYYNVTVTDKAGNKNSTETRKITLDTTNPTINFTYPTEENNTIFSRDWIYVNVTAYDKYEANITFTLYNSSSELINETTYTDLSRNINFTNLNSDVYAYNVTITDMAGNKNSTETRIIILDTIKPRVSLDMPHNQRWLNHSEILFGYTPTDTNLESCVFYHNMSGWNANRTNNNLQSGQQDTFIANFTEGSYIWNVWCNDSAGNSAFNLTNFTFYVDTTKPSVVFISPTPTDGINQTSTTFIVNITHTENNPDKAMLYLNGTINQTRLYSGNYTNFTLVEMPDGHYEYFVRINDTAGNTNETEARSITIDTTEPSIILLNPANNSWRRANVSFYYEVRDALLGIANCSLIINDKINLTNTTIQEAIPQNFTKTLETNNYAWRVNCSDDLGNTNSSEKRIVKVDADVPGLDSPNINGTNFSVATYICLNITASDIGSGVSTVRAIITDPDGIEVSTFLYDNKITSCDKINGDGVYSAEWKIEKVGSFNWTRAYVNDSAGNINSTVVGLAWNSSSVGTMTVSMLSPTTNIEINESEESINYTYIQECTATCDLTPQDCNDVWLYAMYNLSGSSKITTTSQYLINYEDGYYCGNLSVPHPPWWNSSWKKRQKLVINNLNREALHNFTALIKLTPSRINYSYTKKDGTDLRFIDSDNTTELNYHIELWNTSGTSFIWVKIPTINANSNNDYIYMYYNNTNAQNTQNEPATYDQHYTLILHLNETGTNPRKDSTGQQNATPTNYDGTEAVTGKIAGADHFSGGPERLNITHTALNGLTQITTSFWIKTTGDGDGIITGANSLQDNEYLIYDQNPINQYANGGSWNSEQTINDGQWHHITITLNANNASTELYIDGKPAASGTGSIPTGTINIDPNGLYIGSEQDSVGNSWEPNQELDGTLDEFRISNTIRSHNWINATYTSMTDQLITYGEEEENIGESCNHTFTIRSDYSAGGTSWKVWCKASSTEIGSYTSELKVNVSINDHPTANIWHPTNGSWISGVETLNATTSTDDQDIISYTFEIDNNTAFTSPSLACNSSEGTCIFNTTNQTQCLEESLKCYLRLNVTDSDGLKNSTYITIGIDNIYPRVSLNSPGEGYWSNTEEVNFSYVPFDANIDSCVFYHNASGWQPVRTNSSVRSGEEDRFSFSFSDGTYKWNVWCNDTKGHGRFNDTNRTFSVNTGLPQIAFDTGTAPNNTYYNRDWVYINVTAYDENEANITFSIYNTTSAVNITTLGKGNRSINFTHLKMNVRYYYNVTITDTAGNKNSTETRTIYLDSAGPTVRIDLPHNFTAISYSSYIVNASVSDDGIGVNTTTFEYRENNSAPWVLICIDNTKPYNCTWHTANLSEGTSYEVRAYANDSLGNIGQADVRDNITIDRSAPIVSLISPENNTRSITGNVTFTYNASDIISAIANCSLIINGRINKTNTTVTEGTIQSFALIDMPTGSYNWSVNCSDFAGNINHSAKYNLTVAPDTDAPIIRLISPPDNSTYTSEDVTFYYNVSDELSGIANCTLIINNKTNTTDTNIVENAKLSFTVYDVSDGNYSWSVNCTDNSSNHNQGKSSTWRVTVFKTTTIQTNLSIDKSVYEQGEIVHMTTTTFDIVGNPLDTRITTSIIKGNTTLPWWNLSFSYRRRINITNNGNVNLLANSTVNYSIDTQSIINESKMQTNGNDLRIVWWNNETNSWHELDRFVYDINTTNTSVLFKTMRTIQIGCHDSNYYLYYGNSSVTNPPENKAGVYFFWDNFAENTLGSYTKEKSFDYPSEDLDSRVSYNETAKHVDYKAQPSYGKSIRQNLSTLGNSIIEVDQYVDGWQSPYAKLEVAARVNASDTYYYFWMSTNIYDSQMGRYVDGTKTLLNTSTYKNTTQGVWHHLKLVNYNNGSYIRLEAWVDNNLIMSYEDNSSVRIQSLGGFGIGAFQLIGAWDNITVRRYLLQEPEITTGAEELLIAENSSTTGSNGAWEWEWSSWNISLGHYTATSIASKENYNNGADYEQFEIVQDTTGPSIALTSPINSSSQKEENITLHYVVSDNSMFIANCSLVFNGVTNQTDHSISNNQEQNFTIVGLTPGLYNWSVSCTDYNSNTNSSAIWFFNIDQTIPTVELVAPIDGYNTTNSTVDFSFVATDNLNLIIKCNLTLDGNVNSSYIEAINGSTVAVKVENISDGIHYWNITCWDNATNINWSETRMFTIDTSPPTILLNFPVAGDNLSDTTVNFNWTPTDNISPELRCNISIDGKINNTQPIETNSSASTNYSVSGLTEGVHSWNVTCWDRLNNTNTSQTRTFRIDLTNPYYTEIHRTPSTVYNNDTVYLNVTWNDDVGIRFVNISHSATGSMLNYTANYNGNNWYVIIPPTQLDNQENISWYSYAYDFAGNLNATMPIQSFTVENRKPYFSPPLQNRSVNQSDTLFYDINATDPDLDSVTFMDNSTFFNISPTTGIIQWTPKNEHVGNHSINITVCDNSGAQNNCTSGTFIITVHNVNDAPQTFNLTTPRNNSYTKNTTPLFNWTNSTDIDAGDTITYFLEIANNTEFNNLTVNQATSDTNYTLTQQQALTEGRWYWRVKVCDNSGAQNNCSYSTENRTFVIDLTEPSVILNAPYDKINTTGDVTFNWTVIDNLDTNASCNITINGTINNTEPIRTSNGTSVTYSTNFSDGTYSWNVTCWDRLNNTNTSQTRTFNVDMTAPTILIDNPQHGSVVGGIINLSADVTDNYVGVDKAWYQIINSSNDIVNYSTLEKPAYDRDWNSSEVPDGAYTFIVFANDTLGNADNTSINFTVSNAKPIITITIPANNTNYSASFTMYVTVESKLINVTSYNITNSTNNLMQNNSNTTVNSSTHVWQDLVDITNWNDGVYTITVFAMNNIGAKTQENSTFRVDKTAPKYYNISREPVPAYNNDTVYLNISWTDENGIRFVNISHNATGNWKNYTAISTENNKWYLTIPPSELENQETVGWISYAEDSAGNRNQTTLQEFTIQNRQPQFNHTLTDQNATEDQLFVYDINASDPDYDTITYYDNSTFFNISPTTGIIQWTPKNEHVGNHSINITVCDNSGAQNNCTSGTFIITVHNVNDAPQTFNLTTPRNNSYTKNTTPLFNWTNSTDIDAGDTITYFLEIANNTEFNNLTVNQATSDTNYTLTQQQALTEGRWYWRVKACDNSGAQNNCSYSTENRTLWIDTTNPKITLIRPMNNTGDNDGNVTIIFRVNDTSPIANCSLIINNKVNLTNLTIIREENITFEIFNFGPKSYNWTVNCSDNSTGHHKASGPSYKFAVILTEGFSGRTTDFSLVNVSSIPNLIIESPDYGMINYTETIDLSNGTNIDRIVTISYNFVEVNSSANEQLNKSSVIVLYNLAFKETPVILRNNQICPANMCTFISYTTNLSFNISHFTSFSSGENSNLTIWDETDKTIRYTQQEVNFYANYTNRTSGKPINGSGVNCTIKFNDTSATMQFNTTLMSYQYVRVFAAPGIYKWNVSCNGSTLGYEPLNTTDTATITQDTTKPIVVLVEPQNSTWTNIENITFVYNASDNVEISNCSLVINNAINTTNRTILSNATNNFTVEMFSDGSYNWTVNCTDVNGLTAGATLRIVYIDTQRPGIELHTPKSGAVTGTTVNFNFTVTDNMDLNMSCNITVDGKVNSSLSAANGTPTNISISGFGDGLHYWNISCWDNANNTNTSATWNFTTSTTAPVITNVSHTPNITGYGQNVVIRANVTDENGIEWVKLNISYPVNYTAYMSNSSEWYTVTYNYTWKIGKYNYSIIAKNLLGNVNSSEVHSFYINATASIHIRTEQDTYGANRDVNLTRGVNEWWNSSFRYRKEINITEYSGKNLSGYSVKIVVDTRTLIEEGKMQGYCNDTRIVYYNRTSGESWLIPHWIEQGCNTTSTKIWARVPYMAENSTSTVYLYYGNKHAKTVQNGSETFEFFDDFTGGLSKWGQLSLAVYDYNDTAPIDNGSVMHIGTLAGDGVAKVDSKYIYRRDVVIRMLLLDPLDGSSPTSPDADVGMLARSANDTARNGIGSEHDTDTGGTGGFHFFGGATGSVDPDPMQANRWEWEEFIIWGTDPLNHRGKHWFYNETEPNDYALIATSVTSTSTGLVGISTASGHAYIDVFIVRNWTEPEPNVTAIGDEEEYICLLYTSPSPRD